VTAYDTAILAANPAAYWKLDETSGTTLHDSSPNAVSLTIVGAEPERYAITGPNALTIPVGIDWNAVNCPRAGNNAFASFAIGTSFALECWIGSVGNPPGNVGFMTKGYLSSEARPWYSLGFNSSGFPFFWFRDVGGTDYIAQSNFAVGDANYVQRGPWHHIMGIYDAVGTTARLFIDGILAASKTVPNTGWGTGAQPFILNQLATTSGGNWQAAAAVYGASVATTVPAADYKLGLGSTAFYIPQLAPILQQILDSVRKTY
jgi:Concanavalin A-like lectin/glucanases superfamily